MMQRFPTLDDRPRMRDDQPSVRPRMRMSYNRPWGSTARWHGIDEWIDHAGTARFSTESRCWPQPTAYMGTRHVQYLMRADLGDSWGLWPRADDSPLVAQP